MNRIPVLIPISRNLKFGAMEALKNRKSPAFIGAIKNVLQIYKSAGFLVSTALMDGEFQHICGELDECGVTLNKIGKDEHMGIVEHAG